MRGWVVRAHRMACVATGLAPQGARGGEDRVCTWKTWGGPPPTQPRGRGGRAASQLGGPPRRLQHRRGGGARIRRGCRGSGAGRRGGRACRPGGASCCRGGASRRRVACSRRCARRQRRGARRHVGRWRCRACAGRGRGGDGRGDRGRGHRGAERGRRHLLGLRGATPIPTPCARPRGEAPGRALPGVSSPRVAGSPLQRMMPSYMREVHRPKLSNFPPTPHRSGMMSTGQRSHANKCSALGASRGSARACLW